LLGPIAKLKKATVSFVMSVCPSIHLHGQMLLPQDRFLLKLTFEDFSKICREISSLIEM